MSTAEISPDQTRGQFLPEYESAPSSADFLLDAADQPHGEEAYYSGDFPRLPNGLVDLDFYLDYLPDHPDDIAPIVTHSDEKGLRHQHVYYWRSFFRQKSTSRFMRDLNLLGFWRAPYNQLLMRMEEEAKIHEKFKKLVSPPPIETMQKSHVDFGWLDRLGAAAVGRRIALVPEAFNGVAKDFEPHSVARHHSPVEIAGIFDSDIKKSLEQLMHPLVTPQRVITGAISRMARLTNNDQLADEARRRAEIDAVYFPVRIRDPRQLALLSRKILDSKRLVVVREVSG
jgi:hypothetical protein